MSDYLDVAGCKKITDRILQKLELCIESSAAGNHPNSKGYADQVVYDTKILCDFFTDVPSPTWTTQLITSCEDYSKNNDNAQVMGKKITVINRIFFDIKKFNWDTFQNPSESDVDMDSLFLNYSAEVKLNEAIDRLIDCLKIILKEPGFDFGREMKMNIETVIAGLKQSHDGSMNSVEMWMRSAYALVKELPVFDKFTKAQDIITKTDKVLEESYWLLREIQCRMSMRFKQLFCGPNKDKISGIDTACPPFNMSVTYQNKDKISAIDTIPPGIFPGLLEHRRQIEQSSEEDQNAKQE